MIKYIWKTGWNLIIIALMSTSACERSHSSSSEINSTSQSVYGHVDFLEAVGDFNGDGKTDYVQRYADPSWTWWDYQTIIWSSTSTLVAWARDADSTTGITNWEFYRYKIIGVGDIDGNGRSDLIVQQGDQGAFGIVSCISDCKFGESYQRLRSIKTVRKGDWVGSWYNGGDGTVDAIADFNGDGKDDLLVRSPWGIGILAFQGGSLTSIAMASNGTWIGSWRLQASDRILGAADFDGDGSKDILIRQPGWGVGMIALKGTSLSTVGNERHGSWLGSWILQGSDEILYGQSKDFNGDGREEFIIRQPGWGLGVIELSSDGKLRSLALVENRKWIGGWLYNVGDSYFAVKDITGDGKDDILLTSGWGMGIISVGSRGFYQEPGTGIAWGSTYPSGWRAQNDPYVGTGDFNKDGKRDLLFQIFRGKGDYNGIPFIVWYQGSGLNGLNF